MEEKIMVHKELADLFWAMDNYFKERDEGIDYNLEIYMTAAKLAVNNLREERDKEIRKENKGKIIPFRR